MKVVHLPFYDDNLYQTLLMEAQEAHGLTTIQGGGGGTFGRVALTKWKPDVMHFHWLHPYLLRPGARETKRATLLFLAQVMALRARGTRIVWTVHNLHTHENEHPELEKRGTRAFVRLCDAVLAHCECARRDVIREFGVPESKTHVVPHLSYLDAYPDAISRDDARRQLDLPPHALVWGFVGQIRPYKGVFELLEAFERLQNSTSSDEEILLIAGKVKGVAAELHARVEAVNARLGRSAVRFHEGFVPDDELQTFLRASDALVFPYRDALTSGALVLAMSFGRACIAPRLGCMAETLSEDGGFLYDPHQDGALQTALERSRANLTQLEPMGAYNLSLAHEWKSERVAAQTLDIYRSVAGSRGPSQKRDSQTPVSKPTSGAAPT